MECEREEMNYEDAVEASPGDVSGAHDSGLFVFSGSPDLRVYGLAHVELGHVTSRCDLSSFVDQRVCWESVVCSL